MTFINLYKVYNSVVWYSLIDLLEELGIDDKGIINKVNTNKHSITSKIRITIAPLGTKTGVRQGRWPHSKSVQLYHRKVYQGMARGNNALSTPNCTRIDHKKIGLEADSLVCADDTVSSQH